MNLLAGILVLSLLAMVFETPELSCKAQGIKHFASDYEVLHGDCILKIKGKWRNMDK